MDRRIVLDSNGIVAGLRSRRGASARVLSLIGSGAFTHCLSVPLLFEYEDVLKRPGMGVPVSREVVEDVLDWSERDGRPTAASSTTLAAAASVDPRTTYDIGRLPWPADATPSSRSTGGHFVASERFGVRLQTPAEFLIALHTSGAI